MKQLSHRMKPESSRVATVAGASLRNPSKASKILNSCGFYSTPCSGTWEGKPRHRILETPTSTHLLRGPFIASLTVASLRCAQLTFLLHHQPQSHTLAAPRQSSARYTKQQKCLLSPISHYEMHLHVETCKTCLADSALNRESHEKRGKDLDED